MNPDQGHRSRDDEKDKENEDRRQPTPASPTLSPSRKARLVGYLRKTGVVQTYEATHNALTQLVEDRAQHAADAARGDMARVAQGVRQNSPSTADRGAPRQRFVPTTAVDDCWEKVTNRHLVTSVGQLKLCDDRLKPMDPGSVDRVGRRLVVLVKGHLRTCLSHEHDPIETARTLDEQLRNFFAGDVLVGTGPLPDLLNQAIREELAANDSTFGSRPRTNQ